MIRFLNRGERQIQGAFFCKYRRSVFSLRKNDGIPKNSRTEVYLCFEAGSVEVCLTTEGCTTKNSVVFEGAAEICLPVENTINEKRLRIERCSEECFRIEGSTIEK